MITPAQLRLLRAEHNLSQRELGKKLGVSRLTVHNWESDKHRIPIRLQAAIDGLAFAPLSQAFLDMQTVKEYSNYRDQGFPHKTIMQMWSMHNKVITREAQMAIVAEWPDILTPVPTESPATTDGKNSEEQAQ